MRTGSLEGCKIRGWYLPACGVDTSSRTDMEQNAQEQDFYERNATKSGGFVAKVASSNGRKV
jgi:hypothetical protein